MKYSYTPMGVCSRKIMIEIENGIIKDCEFTGGCNGNTQGVASLVKGMDAKDAVKRLQLAICIEKALKQE